MTIEDTIRAVVREELQRVLHEELRAAFAETSPPDADGYFSIASAAAFAEVHPDTVRAWVKSGALPEHRAGRELRVLRSELRAFLAAGRSAARLSAEEEAAAILARRRR